MPKNNSQNQTMLDLGLEVHVNRGLFADHYLEDILPSLQVWQCDDEAEAVLKKLRDIYERHATKFTGKTNEAQTEDDFVKPVLDVLWDKNSYQVQCNIKTPDGVSRTDYGFFRDADTRDKADALKGSPQFWPKAVALGDAKRWNDSLDKRRAKDGSPSNQIVKYLYHAKIRWGILTNGRIWRIYEQDKSRQGGTYYQVDLEQILKEGKLEDFKYFYLFFRRASFVPDEKGKSFLDAVYQGSIDYATTVGDRLKESVYDALRNLINGFFRWEENQLDSSDPDTLRLVHEQSLIVLYRILFTLYAEDRRLLDTENPFYQKDSLRKLQKEINLKLKANEALWGDSAVYWEKLCHIFRIIDQGLSVGNAQEIPAFNGGLFSAGNYPQITPEEQNAYKTPWRIDDKALAWAIDLLAYSHEFWDQPGEGDIDYASLEVRHLGSIYEGLLELQPHIATEDMVEVYDRELKATTFKPSAKNLKPIKIRGQNPRVVRRNEAYLLTNRGGRKSSGSYYTPKYIVDYIVESTLSPLLKEASKKAKVIRKEADTEIKRLEKRLKEQLEKYGTPEERKKFPPEFRAATEKDMETRRNEIERLINIEKQRPLAPFFEVTVLDPAMGSGHFLVGTADYFSLHLATDPSLFDLPEKGDDEDPQIFYKRLVVERCLYGVDLNHLAVELAKLSLWLHTVAKDRALSFLDHHLRCGNSLVGARLKDDLGRHPPVLLESGKLKKPSNDEKQMNFGFSQALTQQQLDRFLNTFHEIMRTPGGSAAIEREKAKLYKEMDMQRARYRAVANLWLSPFYGQPVTPELYGQAVQSLNSDDLEWLAVIEEDDFIEAQRIAEAQHFFHWELEFPEVFLEGEASQRGFSAVIGNPPYVRQETLGSEFKTYAGARYTSYAGTADLYVYFIELGHEALQSQGAFGMITSNKFMRANYGRAIRSYLQQESTLQGIVDFGELPVFADAATFPCIPLTRRQQSKKQSFFYAPIRRLDFESLQTEVRQNQATLNQKALQGENWSLSSAAEQVIFNKMHKCSIPLKRYIGDEIYRGILTGLNEAFVINGETRAKLIAEDPKSEALIKPFIVGDDIRKYHIRPKDQWLILIPSGWTSLLCLQDNEHEPWLARNYRAIYGHLKLFKTQAIKRWDKGQHWWELRACAYYNRFAKAKIFYPIIGKESRFHIDNLGMFSNDKAFFLPTGSFGLLGLLNSSLIWLYLKRHCSALGDPDKGGRLELREIYMRHVPIRKIAFTTPPKERQTLLKKTETLIKSFEESFETKPTLDLVDTQLAAEPERADVVHDLLALLAQRLTDLYQDVQEESAGFLGWMTNTYSFDPASLTKQRSKIESYHEHDFKNFLSALRANKDSFDGDPASRSFQESVEKEFTDSFTKQSELKKRIVALDELVDQIVYKLYGLTDDEIKIVEANALR